MPGELEISQPVRLTNNKHVDAWYGPYESIAAANTAVPQEMRLRRVVGVILPGGIVDHCWRSGVQDTDLVPVRIELQTSATHIQWRYVGDPTWNNLVSLAAITGPQGAQGVQGVQGNPGAAGSNGREVELQTNATHVQWRYAGDVTWNNLISLAAITGPQGPAGSSDWSMIQNKPNVFPADLSGVVMLTGNQTVHGNKTFWDSVSMIGADGKIMGFDAAGFQRFGLVKRIGFVPAIGYIGSFDILRSNAASNMGLADSFTTVASFASNIDFYQQVRHWSGVSVWQADGGAQINFGPTVNATWIRLNSSQQHLQFSRPIDMLDRYMLNGRNAIQFNGTTLMIGGNNITPNNFDKIEIYQAGVLAGAIHESAQIGLWLRKNSGQGNQILLQSPMLNNCYIGISADGRGDVVFQGGGSGAGTDKGMKFNIDNEMTRAYVRGNGKFVHAHDGVLPIESANSDFQIKGRLSIGNIVNNPVTQAHATHKVAIEINGTMYYLHASTSI